MDDMDIFEMFDGPVSSPGVADGIPFYLTPCCRSCCRTLPVRTEIVRPSVTTKDVWPTPIYRLEGRDTWIESIRS